MTCHSRTHQAASAGGRDLGADVSLVGSGQAYDYWRKTAEYQEWLKGSPAQSP